MSSAKKIVIYTLPTCPYCHKAKSFFAANGIDFEEKDVSANPSNREEMIRVSGALSVPVIVIDNSDVIVGWNEGLIREKLGVK
jgi:glutaredoxin-like YruB-family protein